MVWDMFSAVNPVELEEGVKKLREVHGIREATKEESASVYKYIKNISKPTSVDFYELAGIEDTAVKFDKVLSVPVNEGEGDKDGRQE